MTSLMLRVCGARLGRHLPHTLGRVASSPCCFNKAILRLTSKVPLTSYRSLSTTQEPLVEASSTRLEFEADTKKLLEIVAKSLYSEREVFLRELISNASDAIEKRRFARLNLVDKDMKELEKEESNELVIDIKTDKVKRTLTIIDSGIGMSRDEMMENLGRIGRSGSKSFMEQMANEDKNHVLNDTKNIIGQFGVGFYSAFMVADKVEVFSKSSSNTSKGFHWQWDGHDSYVISEASNIDVGTQVVVHLKPECAEYADETVVRDVIKKYSSFVGSDIRLNEVKSNELKPLWLLDPKTVTHEQHEDFYRYVANAFDKPRFVLHFRTDAPMDIRALLYIPESRPGLFETSREGDAGIALYCRKVLINSKADNLVPKWMRFVKGVVDSEDIPLNLSRELLQNSAHIAKLRTVVTNKFLRFVQDRARKEPKAFLDFHKDYSLFFKEGILTSTDQYEKEEIAKVLRFESSALPSGEMTSIAEYGSRMKAGERDIYYICAPSRQLAESSPYYEAFKSKETEVLFCYESYDELVLMQLQQFDKKRLTSVEKDIRQNQEETKEGKDDSGINESEATELTQWIKGQLGSKAAKVRTTSRLSTHPCVITVEEMAAARHFIKTQASSFSEEQRYNILQPQLEINPDHPIVKKLVSLKKEEPELASMLVEQLFANAMVNAGLVDDPRTVLININELLNKALEKW